MNSALAIYEPVQGTLDLLTDEDREEADGLRTEIADLLNQIHGHEIRLAVSFSRLCSRLVTVRNKRYWKNWNYESWGSYVDDLRAHIDRRRSQIYAMLSVADKLLPYLNEEEFQSIGISKCQELARFVKQSGGRNPRAALLAGTEQTLLGYAADKKTRVSDLRAKVSEQLHEKSEEKGTWKELGGAYFLEDEWQEYQDAVKLACRIEPIILAEQPDHVQLKEYTLRMAREFMASYPEEHAT